jgi:hypothetical protein
MEFKNCKILCLSAVVAALATGCAVSWSPPVVAVSPPVVAISPPEAVVTVGVPESYVWDGVEYVGFVGGQYMYLGPGGGWLVCDAGRLDRFHGWERGHPDWRRTATRNTGRDARGRGPARKEGKGKGEERK